MKNLKPLFFVLLALLLAILACERSVVTPEGTSEDFIPVIQTAEEFSEPETVENDKVDITIPDQGDPYNAPATGQSFSPGGGRTDPDNIPRYLDPNIPYSTKIIYEYEYGDKYLGLPGNGVVPNFPGKTPPPPPYDFIITGPFDSLETAPQNTRCLALIWLVNRVQYGITIQDAFFCNDISDVQTSFLATIPPDLLEGQQYVVSIDFEGDLIVANEFITAALGRFLVEQEVITGYFNHSPYFIRR